MMIPSKWTLNSKSVVTYLTKIIFTTLWLINKIQFLWDVKQKLCDMQNPIKLIIIFFF